MTRNRQWYEDFKETSNGENIYLGDDRGYQIKVYGSIPVVLPDGNIRHIHNVMYLPGIKKNLISVSTMTDQNLKVEFYKSYCVIKDLLDCMKPIAYLCGRIVQVKCQKRATSGIDIICHDYSGLMASEVRPY